mmetsp:Transcript_60950/g.108295  ORF Transcript_60950/g.108295 Transcript_60950/m.108295 type:complete len:1353 (-) Transcript_60950:75-4133(-)|eukprot:CAMPEP_0197661320 /NCGR_PEP_ID=MMETSP1338-20131121/51383_1 /TAXON_ID=43686 ORGANISM="Pelagodinium beii, Strain RCC1491" /NCGR_SAMPLE_ID=MMETSP1338 /ASSEMBLY_ACC=CAM_ASM_000754 /LENGTH=1352 /DNA_ID=CAMNT_0043238857 /DNA_START=35 /DNA_END=4093 /DNA_ORIENTATION=+
MAISSAAQAQTLAIYYVREGYYNKVKTICTDEFRRSGDATLSFWKAYALHCEGSTREAILEAEACINKRDMGFPAATALVYFHNQFSTPDQDAIRDMSRKARQEMPDAPLEKKIMAVRFLTLAGEIDKAQEILQTIDASGDESVSVARGWNEYIAGRKANATSGRPNNAYLDSCAALFDAGSGSGDSLANLEALMGKAKVLEGKRQWAQALDSLNKVIVVHAWFLPALIEKAKTLMMTADWEQALETAGRLQQQEPSNIEALRLNVLFLLSRESRSAESAAEKLQALVASIGHSEPNNHDLVLSCAQLFSRLAGRHKTILGITADMMKRTTDAAPEQAKFLTELGYQYMLQGDMAKAEQTFHQAVAKDETDVRALYGIINCRLQEGHLDDAEEQLEFLSEIQISVGKSPDLAYLQSLVAWRKRKDAETALNLLNETLTLHITNFKSAVGYEFFIKLNADFMLDIAREYLQHTSSIPKEEASKPGGGPLLRAVQVLETLTRFVPGLVPAQVLLAKAKLSLGDSDAALRILQQCLKLDPSNADTYLLFARVYLDKEAPEVALQYMEQGLSHDFTVRNHPLYHLVKAQVLETQGDREGAVKVLQSAMDLPGVRTVGGDAKPQTSKTVRLSETDRSALFTLLVALLTKLKRLDDASKAVKNAIAEFAGTSEEVKILIANSQLSIEKGEIDQALNMLRTMKPDHPQFPKAKAAMADIYLKHRKDKKAYARCYKAIVDHAPTVQNYLILGDALLSIQEPDDAIKAFQEALDIEKGKGDPELVRKIGKAMMQTHDYERAIQYYNDALRKHPSVMELRQDLARLFKRLQRWDDAIRELEDALQVVMQDTAKQARYRVQTLVELSKVHLDYADHRASLVGSASGAVPACSECLGKGRDLLNELLSQLGPDEEEQRKQLREESANLNFMLGEYYETRERNIEYAVGYYGETLRHDDAHEKSILALARIHLQKNELHISERQLTSLLRVAPDHEEASMLMAELNMMLAAQGGRSDGGIQEYKDATFYYQALLDKKPGNYTALSKLILLLRRSGQLKEAPRYIEAAEKACTRSPDREAGLRFCRGCLYRYMNKPQDALVELNYARRDPDYRVEAITHMIEIYLMPDPTAGLEALDAGSEPLSENLREVDNLIKELSGVHKQAWNPRLKVYQCQSLMFTKNKTNVERALASLMDLYNDKKDYIPALLAMSQGLVIQKQHTKARNQLKRIADLAKKGYNPEFMDDFEKAWLLLAEIYIQSSKYDLASSLCHIAKDHNRSCGKAWEQLGLIYEKEQAYKDAASHYEKAWEFTNETSPAVGYRLAFNYLKAKRYVPAINICQAVLHISENYPKIKKDVLEKARGLLRT